MNIGDNFGRLKVIDQSKNMKMYFVVECICGVIKEVRRDHLISGKTKSCGCLASELYRKRHTKHGMSKSSEYKTWGCMVHRCENKTDKRYHDYGGRGITVCDRWKSFELFLEDMGHKPFSDAQIDRKNNDDGYHKSNCEWVSRKQNQRNSRSNKIITYNGESAPVIVFAERFNINYSTLSKRLSRGWSVERAIETVPPKNKVKK